MKKIRIVTDSTCDLPKEIIDRYNITVVPLKVLISGNSYRDGIDIAPGEVYKSMLDGQVVTTSQPAPGEFLSIYENILEENRSIISIHISSELSGTAQSARVAKELTGSNDIEVIDSKLVTMALGMVVIEAAKAATEGKSKEEIIARINEIRNKMTIYFLVDNLQYLERGGRIGKAEAFLGTLLNIKPLLTLKDGIINPYEKVRGKIKAMDRLLEVSFEKMQPGQKIKCGIVHSNDPESLKELIEKIKNKDCCDEIMTGELGPVVGSHVGPGLLGIIWYPKS